MQTNTSVIMLDVNLIIPNKYQPRKVFDENALDSLSESIKNYGIINPILVRKKEDKYEIIAGERRFRAAKKLGLSEVPVIIKNANEQEMAELALIENLERQGLNPIEEAKSYEEIMRIGNQTQESLAKKLGKSQSSIANKIRLLSLPTEVQDALSNKKISERHARSLINLENKDKQLEILDRIIKEKLTVKETEQIIKEKDITEEEIKQAISDIMKSLDITDEEEKEEKEDDNMNNGNFFPNFDNNNIANNNASLNMMNMQSMNQPPMAPAEETVLPTGTIEMPQQMYNQEHTPIVNSHPFEQYNENVNMNHNPMNNFVNQQDTFNIPTQPMMDAPMMNNNQFIAPQPIMEPVVSEPQLVVPEPTPMVDTPLFNPEVIMPTGPVGIQPQIYNPEPPMMNNNQFEVPVIAMNEVATEPVVPVTVEVDKLTELQNLLTNNGYTYKVYSNDTENCVIIELPKN